MAKKSKSTVKATSKSKATKRSAMYRARVEIKPETKLAFNHARDRGGIKSDFVSLVPRKGSIPASKLLTLGAKELKVPKTRAERWLPGLVRREVLRISA
jgi:hypothetical protein